MADTDLRGTVIDGRYKVIEPIAEGAMGSVYRGERVQLGRAVAIKVMHQELPDELASRQRFEREAKLMALLEHPNCVSVIDFGLHDDKPFLVMDLVRGTSLIEILDKQVKLDVARSADIVKQVLSGLAHAHELGIVHRDIKPANIMISEKAGLGQQVRILDFGLARLTESSTKLTTGIVVGTPNYMSPEQCKGSDVDARTDLYACGVMLFEMLTGRKPFVANDPIQVVRKHLMEKPPTLASVDPSKEFGELEAVVAKALAKAPGDRFPSAVEMAQAIEAATSKLKMSAAALFARAVPETSSAPAAAQVATMSGWNVPQAAQSSPGTQMMSDSMIVPPPTPPPAPPAPAAPEPSTGTQMLSNSMIVPTASPPPSPSRPATSPGSSPGSSMGTQMLSDSMIVPPVQGPPPPAATPLAHAPTTALPSGVFDGGATAKTPPPAHMPPPAPSAVPAPPARPPSSSTGPAQTVSSGAPDAPISVPPTRPSSTGARAAIASSSSLPFTKQQMLIAGGGLFALVVIIAIVAGGGGSSKTPTSTGTAKPGTIVPSIGQPAPDPASDVVERANALIASEEYEEAVAMLKRARKDSPDNAELAFLSGKANFGRLWWSDGIADFRDAIRADASYKENPELLKTVLKGFITTPDVDSRIVEFMRNDIGAPMRPYLEETADKHPRKPIRARARAELNAGGR